MGNLISSILIRVATGPPARFTSNEFTTLLEENEIHISRDGKGRALDNIFIERFWRSLKYEHVYLNPATDGVNLYEGIHNYIQHYNYHRPHQSLDYKTPFEIFQQEVSKSAAWKTLINPWFLP